MNETLLSRSESTTNLHGSVLQTPRRQRNEIVSFTGRRVLTPLTPPRFRLNNIVDNTEPSSMTHEERTDSSLIFLLNRFKIENAQLRNIIYQEKDLEYIKRDKIIQDFHDTLFEHSEEIPSGIYVKLMNILIGKN